MKESKNPGIKMNTAMRTVTQRQEQVIYLEDAERHNNVCIVGIEEGAEERDIQGFLQKLISETLDVKLAHSGSFPEIHSQGGCSACGEREKTSDMEG